MGTRTGQTPTVYQDLVQEVRPKCLLATNTIVDGLEPNHVPERRETSHSASARWSRCAEALYASSSVFLMALVLAR